MLKILHKQASDNLSMGTLQSSLPHCINAQSETIRIFLKTHHFNYKNYFFLVLEIASMLKETLSLFNQNNIFRGILKNNFP